VFCLFIVSLTTVSAAVHPLIEATVKPAACCSCAGQVASLTVSIAVHRLIEAIVKPAACCSCAGQVAGAPPTQVQHVYQQLACIQCIVSNCCTLHYQCHFQAYCSCAGQVAGASPTQVQHMYQQLACIQCIVSNCCTLHYQRHFQAYCPCAGQVAGASPTQVQHMYQQLSVLGNLTEGFVHRIGPEQLFKDLPAKHEHVVLLCLDAAQQAMYKAYLEVRPEAQDKL